jgi:hypothetical protein
LLENATIDHQDTSKHATSAFLLALIDFAQVIGFFDPFCFIEVTMKEVEHTVVNKIITIVLSVAISCRSTYAINARLRPDHLAAQALGFPSFPEQSTISRLYGRVDADNVTQVHALHQFLLQQHGLSPNAKGLVVVDIDRTGLVANGDHFELACKGYFAKQKGAKGYQLAMAAAANLGPGPEVLAHFLDPGNVHANSRFEDLIYEAGEALAGASEDAESSVDIEAVFRRMFIRADAASGSGKSIEFLIEHGIGFLIKGASTATAQRLAREWAGQLHWVGVDQSVAVAELGLQKIHRCPYPVRIILVRVFNPRKWCYEYSHLLTSLPSPQYSEVDLFHFYNKRTIIEKLIERCKNVLGLAHLPTRQFEGLQFFVSLSLIAYNLVLWYDHHVLASTPEFSEGTPQANLAHLKVPSLMSTVSLMQVVAEQVGHEMILYVATAHRYVAILLKATMDWLDRWRRDSHHRLGLSVNLTYDDADFYQDIWLAGHPRSDPLSCKG